MKPSQFTARAVAALAISGTLALTLSHDARGAALARAHEIERTPVVHAIEAALHGQPPDPARTKREADEAVVRYLMRDGRIAGVAYNEHDALTPTGHIVRAGDADEPIGMARIETDYGTNAHDTALDLVRRAGAFLPVLDLRDGRYKADADGNLRLLIVPWDRDTLTNGTPRLSADIAPTRRLADLGIEGASGPLARQDIPVIELSRDDAVNAALQIDRSLDRADLGNEFDAARSRRISLDPRSRQLAEERHL